MEIYLPAEIEEMLKRQVEAGMYNSVNEAIVVALWMLDDWHKMQEMRTEELRKEIQKGLDSGPATPLDFEEVKAQGRKRLAEERAKSS